jgi:hypothetical protein
VLLSGTAQIEGAAMASGLESCSGLQRVLLAAQGAELLKHGRLGRPKVHHFRLAEADAALTWRSSNGRLRSIPLSAVTQARAPLHAPLLLAPRLLPNAAMQRVSLPGLFCYYTDPRRPAWR